MSHDLLTLPSPRSLGAFVKARRTVLGLSQTRLAKMLGVNQSTVSSFEAGRDGHEPKISTLERLAKALEVDVRTLIDFVVK